MMRKQVVFIANSLENAFKFQQVLTELGVETAASSPLQMKNLLKPGALVDLVVFEAIGPAMAYLEEVVSLAENQSVPLLVIIDQVDLGKLQLPTLVDCDFVINGAEPAECSARLIKLLGGRQGVMRAEMLVVDDMAINTETYQVTVGDEPVDLTFLEYTLLVFFARHPGRTFSRESLLQHVWGFDYLGGSRTVDVHVRRIRAKLGPGLSQHLETVRGVGYLWN